MNLFSRRVLLGWRLLLGRRRPRFRPHRRTRLRLRPRSLLRRLRNLFRVLLLVVWVWVGLLNGFWALFATPRPTPPTTHPGGIQVSASCRQSTRCDLFRVLAAAVRVDGRDWKPIEAKRTHPLVWLIFGTVASFLSTNFVVSSPVAGPAVAVPAEVAVPVVGSCIRNWDSFEEKTAQAPSLQVVVEVQDPEILRRPALVFRELFLRPELPAPTAELLVASRLFSSLCALGLVRIVRIVRIVLIVFLFVFLIVFWISSVRIVLVLLKEDKK